MSSLSAMTSLTTCVNVKRPSKGSALSNHSNYVVLTARALFVVNRHVLHSAVVPSVPEVDHQPNQQPDNQTRPIYPPQFVHHIAVEQDAHDRDKGYPGRAERSRLPGIGLAQDHDRDAHD